MVINQQTIVTDGTKAQLHRLGHRIAQLGLLDLLAAYGDEEERQAALRFDLPFLPERLDQAVQPARAGASPAPTVMRVVATLAVAYRIVNGRGDS